MFKDDKHVEVYNGPNDYDILESILSNLVNINHNEMSGGGYEKKDIILFKAEWCTHCIDFKSTWKRLQTKFNKKFNFITYDQVKDSKIMEIQKVNSFPTIMFKNKDDYTTYDGSREYKKMYSILTNL